MEMVKNIKARLWCKPFNIWTEIKDDNRKKESFFMGYYIYKNTIYFGCPFGIFFVSHHNEWYKTKAE